MTGAFRTSGELDQIAPALVAVFAVSRTVGTDASAKIDTKGGDGYRYDYATLSQVYGAVRASLADAGVVPMQTTVIDEAAGAVVRPSGGRLLRRADGSVRDVESFSGPIQIGEREVIYSIVHDVTERVRAEMEHDTVRRSLDAVDDAVLMFDPATLQLTSRMPPATCSEN